MISKLKISVLLFFISASLVLKANEKKDTIQLFLPNKAILEVVSVDVNRYKLDTAFVQEYLDRFFQLSEETNLDEQLSKSPCFIVVKPYAGDINRFNHEVEKDAYWDLSVKDREVEHKILVSSDLSKKLDYSLEHQLQFQNKIFTINILFDELNQLKDLQNHKMLFAIDSLMDTYHQGKSKNIENDLYEIHSDYSLEKINENTGYTNDQILLDLGTGIESVKNVFAINLEASMTFCFYKKGINKNSYGASYEFQYDFSTYYYRNINHFLNLYYMRNFSDDPDRHNTYKFKVGYLLNRDGSMFDENTFCISVAHMVGKYFVLQPKIYFSGAFKDITPAINIGINIF